MPSRWRLSAIAIAVCAVVAVIFKVFEFIVNHGQQWIWNDIFHSDTTRWLVIPLAIGLGLLFGLVLIVRKAPRWLDPETDIFSRQGDENKKTTLSDIFETLAIGASSLLAGAPLGPEMPLTESAAELGKWTSGKLKLGRADGAILVVSALGGLMVAFLGSLVMMALPFLLILKKDKELLKVAAAPIILGSLSAYGSLWLMDHHTEGYGSIPASGDANIHDYLGAIAVALGVSVLALALLRLIARLAKWTKDLDSKLPWYSTAIIFGAGIGVLYLIGGETVQFSGSAGSQELLANSAQYGTWAFLGLAIVKLLVVAWAKTTGYRGGLYFPSIFASVALGLFIVSLADSLNGPGVLIGAVAAIFAALGFPDKKHPKLKDYAAATAMSFVIILALIPFDLIFLAVIAVLAAAGGNVALSKIVPEKPQ